MRRPSPPSARSTWKFSQIDAETIGRLPVMLSRKFWLSIVFRGSTMWASSSRLNSPPSELDHTPRHTTTNRHAGTQRRQPRP
ncbi:MAG: hypothetical protein GC164_09940 [Phycisphaera sp.]|nr:hypothetical protein [Phycisphaera sp.]